MPRVLVVDDCELDRRLAAEFLEQSSSLELDFADGGVAAFESFRRRPADCVLTDLLMPDGDGLELVRRMRDEFPLVPVVVMTSRGSERTAVAALTAGAASYVPKQQIKTHLLDTIEQVLIAAGRQKDEARVLSRMTGVEYCFELENDSTLVAALVHQLQDDARSVGLCEDGDSVRLGVALDEALMNSLYHGNLEISSQIRDADERAYNELVKTRLGQSPYRERSISVDVSIRPDRGEFVVRDEGPGFDFHKVYQRLEQAGLDNLGGRGLLLMKTFMDEVRFSRAGNEVTMVKRRPKAASAGQA